MLATDTLEGEVSHGILHCGVGLQTDVLLESVEVETCYASVLFGLRGFTLDDGGEGRHFEGGESEARCFFGTLPLPEAEVTAMDAIEHGLRWSIPSKRHGLANSLSVEVHAGSPIASHEI